MVSLADVAIPVDLRDKPDGIVTLQPSARAFYALAP